MGLKKWSIPWRLHSKGLSGISLDLSIKDKVISGVLLCISLILLHFLMHLAF